MRCRRRARAGLGDSGATAVEFALVAMLLFPLLFAVIEFSRGVHARNALNAVADHTVRTLLLAGQGDDHDATALAAQLLEVARDPAYGLIPERLSLTLIRNNTQDQIELRYQLRLLVPALPVNDLTLSTRRVAPRR